MSELAGSSPTPSNEVVPSPLAAAEAALARGDHALVRRLLRGARFEAASPSELARADDLMARLRPDRAALAVAAVALVLFAVLFVYYAR